jgi:uncharacterized membrane protein YdjX (TVP38/TMEM64 family)
LSEHREIPEPGELVYAPRSSWLPAVLAVAVAVAVGGIYAEGFLVRGWIYSIIGLVVAFLALRALTRDSVREFFGLRRKQQARGAVLPVETISAPKRG